MWLPLSGKVYPIKNDVIVCDISLSSESNDIQTSFGEEWQRFDKIEPEHESEFDMYFSQVDLGSLNNKVVCDVGCGMGRWSWILLNK